MGNLESLMTWVLGIAFVLYLGLTNCCSETSNQRALDGQNANINNAALEINISEVKMNAMALELESPEIAIIEIDTTKNEVVKEEVGETE